MSDYSELDERKSTILTAIIKNYLESGEPVGSRTISKLPDLNLSSATIRNEMSDLVEMGYIEQPHTSAGRIPTDKGYRFYVDQIQKSSKMEVAEFKELMVQRVDKLELVLRQLAKLIAANTNYAAMISGPSGGSNRIKFIQLSRMEERKILLSVVFEGNVVKNRILQIQELLSDDTLSKLNFKLNTSLNGLMLGEINLEIINKLKEDAGEYRYLIENILDELAETFKQDAQEAQIYTSGATNIFKYPELADGAKASKIISTFEEKDALKNILDEANAGSTEDGIQVYIGDELPNTGMQDCSVVTANYEFGDGIKGTIGIVGPKRMDYERVLGTLRTVMKQLDKTFGDS